MMNLLYNSVNYKSFFVDKKKPLVYLEPNLFHNSSESWQIIGNFLHQYTKIWIDVKWSVFAVNYILAHILYGKQLISSFQLKI